MTRRYGIDNSVLVRLLTREPQSAYEYCITVLADIVEGQNADVVASNQVIGEAYVVAQIHYGASKSEAKSALLDAFQSGYVSPTNGETVFAILQSEGGAGVLDRLIADGYSQEGRETLTLDRQMSNLPDTRIL